MNVSYKDIKNLLLKSPVAAAVDASDWSPYVSGVFSCNGTPQQNHAILVVGYDVNGNYIIKNSWGTNWGNNGYITLSKDNDCGIKQNIYAYQM